MSDSPDSTTAPEKSPARSNLVGWDMLPYVGVFAAGLATMWANIRTGFYLRGRNGFLKYAYDWKKQEVAKISEAIKAHVVEGKPFEIDVAARRRWIKETGEGMWNKGLKLIGVDEGRGLKPTWQRFMSLQNFDKIKSIAVGVTVMSVGLGAILGLRQRHILDERLARAESKNKQDTVSYGRA